ncbi:protein of unknown function [Streptomyces sp. KY70]|nr:protein of unknown function [Streptomyces sp. KY70]
MKRMPPRSRRLCSQPLSRTSVPTSEARSSPQVWDLYRCIVVHPVFAIGGGLSLPRLPPGAGPLHFPFPPAPRRGPHPASSRWRTESTSS